MDSLKSMVDIIEKLPTEVQVGLCEVLDSFWDDSIHEHHTVSWKKCYDILCVEGLLEMNNKPFYRLHGIIEAKAALMSISFPFPSTLKKNKDGKTSQAAIKEWMHNNKDKVIEVLPSADYRMYASVGLSQILIKHLNGVKSYLRRKFIDIRQIHVVNGDEYLVISPVDSKVLDYHNMIFSFPEDEITELLNLYSANRCVSKKEGIIQREKHFKLYTVFF